MLDRKIIDKSFTEAFICSQINENQKLTSDRKSYFYNPNLIITFSLSDYQKYILNYDNVVAVAVTENEIEQIISGFELIPNTKAIKYWLLNNKIVLLQFEPKFFKLNGKKNKKIRYVRNYYSKLQNIKILEEPVYKKDVKAFLRKWKLLRKNSTNRPRIGIDRNFIFKYALKNNEKFIKHFFYFDDTLIGYSIIEKVDENHYNHLCRKADTTFNNLGLYIDFFAYNEISNKLNNSFIVNIGNTGGHDSLLREKTENFPVFFVFDCFDITVKKTV
ncbi:MAG: hypothetical protein EPN82_06020 [Bacteroidetes bacterium]|nr:MAG: hypothetical protein EPN82_06020 [Bacteroidota bacterium]